ncbi:MAG: hypothetical protein EOO15_14195 [Chitinophagaceae bacterium]|nr:MAG: hypothetical protein EOO15_14195 [Chitinophagaceae bacterium]
MSVLWKHDRLFRASVEYWLLLIALAGGFLYHNGVKYREACVAVEGLVTDQVGSTAYRLNMTDIKPRPQFRYTVEGETYEAVPPNAEYPTGARATLLALRSEPREIRVYNIGYWVHFGFDTFPIFLFGGLLYAGLLVHAWRLKRKLLVLARAEELLRTA